MRAEAKLSLADLAGRSCPHRWTRSGLQHPGGPRRENPAPLSLNCHFYSNKYTKNGGELAAFGVDLGKRDLGGGLPTG